MFEDAKNKPLGLPRDCRAPHPYLVVLNATRAGEGPWIGFAVSVPMLGAFSHNFSLSAHFSHPANYDLHGKVKYSEYYLNRALDLHGSISSLTCRCEKALNRLSHLIFLSRLCSGGTYPEIETQ